MTNKIELTFDQIKELVKLGLVKSKKKRKKNGKTKRVISKKHLIRALEQTGHNVDGNTKQFGSKVKFFRAPKESRQTSSHMRGNVIYAPQNDVSYPLSNVGNTLQTEALRLANERAEVDLKQQKEKRPVTDSKKKYLLDSIPLDNRIDIDDDELFNMYQKDRKKLEHIKTRHPYEYEHIRNNPSLWNDDTWEAYGALNADDDQTRTTRATKMSHQPGDELYENADETDNISDVTFDEHEEQSQQSRFDTQSRAGTLTSLGSLSTKGSSRSLNRQTESTSIRLRDQGNAFESEFDPVHVAVEVRKPAEHNDESDEYDGDDEDTYKTENTHSLKETPKEKIDVPVIQENPIEPVKAETKPAPRYFMDSWSTKHLTPEQLANFDPETAWGVPIKKEPKKEPKEEPKEEPIVEPIVEPQEEPKDEVFYDAVEEPHNEPVHIEQPEEQKEEPKEEPPKKDIFDDDGSITGNQFRSTQPRYNFRSRFPKLLAEDHPEEVSIFGDDVETIPTPTATPEKEPEKVPKKKKKPVEELAVIPEEPYATPEKKPKKKKVTIDEPIKEQPKFKQIEGILPDGTELSKYSAALLKQIARQSNAKTNDDNDPYDKPIVTHTNKLKGQLYNDLKKAGIIK